MSKNKLTLYLEKPNARFLEYLKNFAKIANSLLLEIDPFGKQFIAKTFTEAKDSVRFSAVTFDDCGMNVLNHDQTDEVKEYENYRIKLGVLSKLSSVIKIIDRFESDNKSYNIIINYDFKKDERTGEITECIAENIQFTSDVLSMKLDGFRPTEFRYLSDDTFNNKVAKIDDPIEFELTSECISNIIKTSEIVKVDDNKDMLVFYNKGKKIYVKDHIIREGDKKEKKELPENFSYLIGELSEAPGEAIHLPIFRKCFICMLDKTNENYTVLIGNSVSGVPDRLVLKSNDTETKIVISTVNE